MATMISTLLLVPLSGKEANSQRRVKKFE